MLERALALAEPEGYVRVFAGEGQPMATLLGALDRRQPGRTYVRRLLHAATGPHPEPAGKPGGPGRPRRISSSR